MKIGLISNKTYKDWFIPAISILTSIILMIFNIYLGLIFLGLSLFALYKALESEKKQEESIKEYVDKLDFEFEGITKNAIFKMPFPIAVLNNDGKILWYNNIFKEMTGEQKSLLETNIENVLPDFGKEKEDETEDNLFEYKSKKYRVYSNTVKEKKEENLTLWYFIDESDYQNLKIKSENDTLAVLNVYLDNYDEIFSSTPSERRPLLFAQVDRIISLYFHDFGSIVKKYENDKYIGITTQEKLEKLKEDKFSVVERVREVKLGNTIQPTLSIGIGLGEQDPRTNERSSNGAVEIALGRGGDQVVLKKGEELEYFGGKNKATEKRTKVKARVIAHALGQLIDKSTEVYVMGHKNPDMDSFGSALGLCYAVKKRDKKVYLVLNEVTSAIKNLYSRAMENLEWLDGVIVTPDEAYINIKPSSLIIVTDNHRKNSTEEPRLFEKSDNIFVIDHHRRGKDYIDHASLIYMEPYASSSSELVTEMLMYIDPNPEIDTTVAEGLLAGITVDTKNFFIQTGVRTFEAASVLKRNGADSMVVKQLFKDDMELMIYKSEIISTTERFGDNIVIGTFDRDLESSNLIASQAADDLLNAEGIDASFVLTRQDGRTHISARSLGAFSVQLIMEKLNGGGHLTSAATQLDMTIDEAKEKLKEAIQKYTQGE